MPGCGRSSSISSSRTSIRYLIVPYVARRAVDLAPALVLSAQILFGAMFGLLGADARRSDAGDAQGRARAEIEGRRGRALRLTPDPAYWTGGAWPAGGWPRRGLTAALLALALLLLHLLLKLLLHHHRPQRLLRHDVGDLDVEVERRVGRDGGRRAALAISDLAAGCGACRPRPSSSDGGPR